MSQIIWKQTKKGKQKRKSKTRVRKRQCQQQLTINFWDSTQLTFLIFQPGSHSKYTSSYSHTHPPYIHTYFPLSPFG